MSADVKFKIMVSKDRKECLIKLNSEEGMANEVIAGTLIDIVQEITPPLPEVVGDGGAAPVH